MYRYTIFLENVLSQLQEDKLNSDTIWLSFWRFIVWISAWTLVLFFQANVGILSWNKSFMPWYWKKNHILLLL